MRLNVFVTEYSFRSFCARGGIIEEDANKSRISTAIELDSSALSFYLSEELILESLS